MMNQVVSFFVFLLAAVILHEYAHGWVANRLGDPTAKMAGRLTLNPIKHIDPVGTLLLPGILITLRMMGYQTIVFGWAKPVPVNFTRLNNPKTDMIWVALAGPAVNIIMAVMFSRLLNFNVPFVWAEIITIAIFINLLLAAFNMIPVPPLDGSRLVSGLLPNRLAAQYGRLEPYGILIVVGLIYFGLLERIILPVVFIMGKLLGVSLL